MKKRQEHLQQLTRIAQNATEPIPKGNIRVQTFFRQAVSFSLADEVLADYESLLENFEQEWGDKLSTKFIDESLVNAISHLIFDKIVDNAELYIEQLYKTLNDAPIDHTVYIPIEGIELDQPVL